MFAANFFELTRTRETPVSNPENPIKDISARLLRVRRGATENGLPRKQGKNHRSDPVNRLVLCVLDLEIVPDRAQDSRPLLFHPFEVFRSKPVGFRLNGGYGIFPRLAPFRIVRGSFADAVPFVPHQPYKAWGMQ